MTSGSQLGLGARLRASAHEAEDDAAAQLRRRLRQKMFGVERRPALPRLEPIADPEVEAPRSNRMSVLGWSIPVLAAAGLLCVTQWTGPEPASAHHPYGRALALPSVDVSGAAAPAAEPSEPSREPPGPGLLEAALALPEGAAREAAVTGALAAEWPDPAATARVDAAVSLAAALCERGEGREAISVARVVLDELELRGSPAPGRVRLLGAVAAAYEVLGRREAAEAVRTELARVRLAAR